MAKKQQPRRARSAKRSPAKPQRIVKTIAAAAQELGVSSRVVSDYLARGCPGKPGHYDLDEMQAWRDAHLQKKPERSALADTSQLLIEKLRHEVRKLREEARFKRNKNRRDEGAFYPKALVDQAWGEAFARIRNRLEAIPDELEMTFPSETRELNKDDCRQKIKSILREMSRWTIDDNA